MLSAAVKTAHPFVAEARGTGAPPPGPARLTVVEALPTAHARRLDIFGKLDSGSVDVYLRSYSAGREFYVEKLLASGITDSSWSLVVDELTQPDVAIGATVDVQIQTTDTGLTITCWAIARKR